MTKRSSGILAQRPWQTRVLMRLLTSNCQCRQRGQSFKHGWLCHVLLPAHRACTGGLGFSRGPERCRRGLFQVLAEVKRGSLEVFFWFSEHFGSLSGSPHGRTKQSGRYEVASFMVGSGCVAWSADDNTQRKQELVFPPMQLDRTTAPFLTCCILKMFEYIIPVQELLQASADNGQTLQFLLVADSASANCKLIPYLFQFLREHGALSMFSPCLLHQMARLLVLNLERQGVSSPSALFCFPHMFGMDVRWPCSSVSVIGT